MLLEGGEKIEQRIDAPRVKGSKTFFISVSKQWEKQGSEIASGKKTILGHVPGFLLYCKAYRMYTFHRIA